MPQGFRTIALYKPYGVLCQFRDATGRPTLAPLVPIAGIYPAGRLDHDSEGLLLLTDDGAPGAPAHRPTVRAPQDLPGAGRASPRAEGTRCAADRRLAPRRNDPSGTGRAARDRAPACPTARSRSAFAKTSPQPGCELSITEGRNRQVRRMTAAVGHPTLRLVRVAIGPVTLGDLAPGQWRELSTSERNRPRCHEGQVASRFRIN